MRTARGLFEGVRAAFTAFCVYGAFLLTVCALANLIATVETDGPSLSASTTMATVAFLISEGTTVHVSTLRLGLMPLGLTVLLVALLATFIRRRAAHWQGFLGGLATWTLMSLAMLNLSHLSIEQGDWAAIGRADACYLAGFLLAVRPQVAASPWLRDRIRAMLPAQVRSLLARGGRLALRLIVAYLMVGLVTVVVWTVRGHATVGGLFEASGMPMGSRIVTSAISLAWLPNLMMWAIAWIFGAGFHIGAIATLTMWSATSTGLPPLPVFGILPGAVASDTVRFVLLAVPVAVAAAVCCVDVFVEHRRELMAPIPVGPDAPGAHPVLKIIARVVLPLLVMTVGVAVLVLVSLALFALSNGTLGTGRLDGIGVDMAQALHAVGMPAMAGCGIVWLICLLVLSARYGWQMFRLSRSSGAPGAVPDAAADAASDGSPDGPGKPKPSPDKPSPGLLDRMRGMAGKWRRGSKDGAPAADGDEPQDSAAAGRPRRTASSAGGAGRSPRRAASSPRRATGAAGTAETRSNRVGRATGARTTAGAAGAKAAGTASSGATGTMSGIRTNTTRTNRKETGNDQHSR